MGKKIFIVIFILLFLSSCGSEGDTKTSGLVTEETKVLSIEIPSNWVVIKEVDKILPQIRNGKIELAVTSENLVNGFANNLLILSDELDSFTSSKDFSMLNNIGASTDYLDYKKLISKDILFQDEEVSVLYVFEAKYNIDTPKLKFLQTARVCNQKNAFLLTIAIPTAIDDTSKYEFLLSTFKCK